MAERGGEKKKVKLNLMNYYISERHVTKQGSSGGW